MSDRDLLTRVEQFIQKPHYGPKRFFLLVDVQKAIAALDAEQPSEQDEGGADSGEGGA